MIIKMNDILAAANAKVAEYMADGYMIAFGDSSFGYAFRVDMVKGKHCIRIKVCNSRYNDIRFDSLILAVVEVNCPEEFEPKDAEPLFIREFYAINPYSYKTRVFTESLDEINEIVSKKAKRYHARYGYTAKEGLTLSAAFIRKLKRRKGFSNATRNNITVQRVEDGYEIKLMGKKGLASRVEVIRFPR